ncbi:hypothetical protein ACQ4PT_012094 [Festuca glaucescens]
MAESSRAREGRASPLEVNELLKNLKLHGEELNDVVLGQEEVRRWPAVKWLAVARILTKKPFSMQPLKNTMLAAWNPAQDVTFHELEPNLFVLQAHCLGDWKRIMEDGPWLFRGCALMTEPFDGATMVPTVIPSGVQVWAQIHKIPPLFRRKEVIVQLARRVGEFISADLVAVQTMSGVFHRVRVKLDSVKPLTRFVPLALEGSDRMFLQVKYEKLPKYCEHCGLMGHTYLECGTGEHEESERQFGEWMISEEMYWKPGTPGVRARTARDDNGGRGRGPVGGRGGGARGAGRGGIPERNRRKWVPKANTNNRKRNSAKAGLGDEPLDDLEDTAASPVKQPEAPAQEDGSREVGAKKNLEEAFLQEEPVPPPPPRYVTPIEKKKLRKARAVVLGKGETESVPPLRLANAGKEDGDVGQSILPRGDVGKSSRPPKTEGQISCQQGDDGPSIGNVAPKVKRTMEIDDVVGNTSVRMSVPVPEPDGGGSGSSTRDSAMDWSMIIAAAMMILMSALVMKNRHAGSEGWAQEGVCGG